MAADPPAPSPQPAPSGRPLRVLHVSEPDGGGVEVVVRTFTRSQVEAGLDVHLLTPPDRAETLVTTRHDWSIRRGAPRSALDAARELRRVAREAQPDVVHLHSFVAGFIGRLPGVVPAGVPVVYQPHAWAFDLFTGARKALVVSWERYAQRRTDMLVTNCTEEIDRGRRHGVRSPARAVGLGVDPAVFRPPTEAERAEAKRLTGYAERRLVVVVGRLAFQKAQDLLVGAWGRHRPADTDLVLVGPGDPGDLVSLAGPEWDRSVHHAGGTDDVRRWMWAADVLAVPSRYETVSLVAIEAMAVGLPVVATAFDGVGEALGAPGPSAAGTVVEIGDMDGLIEELSRRLDAPGPSHGPTSAGRTRVLSGYTPDHVHAELVRAYESAVTSRRSR